jgi:hypothetical protein
VYSSNSPYVAAKFGGHPDGRRNLDRDLSLPERE